MKTIFLYSMLLFFCFLEASKEKQKFPKTVCGLNNPISPYELENNTPIQKSSILYKYLEDLKKVFNSPYAKYTLRSIDGRDVATAHLQKIGKNEAARVITINEKYFTSQTTSEEEKKALLIWVMGHEIQHHINGDLHYDQERIAPNLIKEILADEQAGYAVGKLTNIGIEFFEKVLPKILSNKNNETHPQLKYRIMAAQSGWINAKLENTDEIIINAETYMREPFEKGSTVTFKKIKDTSAEMICIRGDGAHVYAKTVKNGGIQGDGIAVIYESSDPDSIGIMFGNMENGQSNGQCTIILNSGFRYEGITKMGDMEGQGTLINEDGNKYIGEFKNNKFSGEGTMYYTNDEVYRGSWLNDKKHGDGILYKEHEILQIGCWKEDIFLGQDCN